MGMEVLDWQDMHNDNGGDEHDKVTQTGEIELSDFVFYEYEVDVMLFRGVPCSAEVTKMTRCIVDYLGGGDIFDTLELDVSEFPHYICAAIEKKHVEEY